MKTECKPLTCTQAQDLMFDYLDGQLSAIDERRLLAHIEVCGECKAELDERRKMLELISSVELEVPASLHSDVMRKIEDIPQDAKILTPKKRIIPWGTIAAACAVVMIMIAGRGTAGMTGMPDIAAERTMDQAAIHTPAAEGAGGVYGDATPSDVVMYSAKAIDDDEGVVMETTAGLTMLSPTTSTASKKEAAAEFKAADSVSVLDHLLAEVTEDHSERAILILRERDFAGLEPDSDAESFKRAGMSVSRYTIVTDESSDAMNTFTGYVKLFEQQKIQYRALVPADSEFDACEIWLVTGMTPEAHP